MGPAMLSNPDRVHVADLPAAALLISEGCHLAAIEPTADSRRRTFVITGDGAKMRRLLDEFARGEVVVDLDAYLAAQRLLKDRLFRSERVRPHGTA